MHCAICGNEEDLTGIRRYWSPDDGWRYGRMCKACWQDYGRRKPHKEDFAYGSHREMTDCEFESYLDSLG